MKKTIAIILSALMLKFPCISIKAATAIEDHAVETVDGQIWGIDYDLAIGKNYIVVFNTLGDNILENDEIIIISEIL